jgi:pimeloyl-ACP methyl ester carboxylesterase
MKTTLVLLHGFGEDNRIWNEQSLLADETILFMPNLAGTGGEPAPANWSMEEMAEDVRQQLDDAGIDECVLVGHSMGGYVALAFAEKWPERLLGLGLFHSTAFADTQEKKETRAKGIAFI